MADSGTIGLRRSSKDRLECRDYAGVELTADRLREAHTRHSTWHRVPVRPVRGHRVVRIGNSDDSREQWNLVARAPVRVPVPVYALVMMAHDSRNFSVIFDLREYALANF